MSVFLYNIMFVGCGTQFGVLIVVMGTELSVLIVVMRIPPKIFISLSHKNKSFTPFMLYLYNKNKTLLYY